MSIDEGIFELLSRMFEQPSVSEEYLTIQLFALLQLIITRSELDSKTAFAFKRIFEQVANRVKADTHANSLKSFTVDFVRVLLASLSQGPLESGRLKALQGNFTLFLLFLGTCKDVVLPLKCVDQLLSQTIESISRAFLSGSAELFAVLVQFVKSFVLLSSKESETAALRYIARNQRLYLFKLASQIHKGPAAQADELIHLMDIYLSSVCTQAADRVGFIAVLVPLFIQSIRSTGSRDCGMKHILYFASKYPNETQQTSMTIASKSAALKNSLLQGA